MKIIKDIKEAVEIILNQKIVAIFQGHSEWGARALGNRSFLYDPRNPQAKIIINKFKGRQFCNNII
jgi:carbamoyltransferase